MMTRLVQEPPPSPVQPRPRASSSQHSSHRDYFVYADPSTATPHLHLRGHRRSRTLPHVPIRDLPVQLEPITRSHSVGNASDHARTRVDEWSDGSQKQHGSDETPLTVTHITVTDSSTPTDKMPDTLPTIPGSSASSQVASDTQQPSPPTARGEDTTDTQATPTRSLSTPVRSPTRRSIDHRSTDPSSHTSDSFNSRVYVQGQRRAVSERRTRRHSGTTKPPQTALAVNTRPEQDEPLADYHYWDLPPSPPPPELPEKEATGYRVINPDPPTPPQQRPQIRVETPPAVRQQTMPSNEYPANHDHEPENETSEAQVPPTVTQYMSMLLAVDKIPRIHNFAASFFTWILLAGFVLFPGTFTSLKNTGGNNTVTKEALNVIDHVSLFVIAFLCSGIGAAGMGYLWWRWMKNYVWLVNKVFLYVVPICVLLALNAVCSPGLLNSFAGVISTLSSVYGAQHGEYSSSSKVTLIVTVTTTFICGVLTLYYLMWKIRRIKAEHDQVMGKQRAGKRGEGFIERIKRETITLV